MMLMIRTAPYLAATLSMAYFAATARADELTNTRQLRPNQSVAFKIDANAVLAFFRTEDRVCKAVMWVATPPAWSGRVATFATSKFEADIPNGKSGRFVPVSGRPFTFECRSEGQIMVLRPLRSEIDQER